jgi:hypothetical protein
MIRAARSPREQARRAAEEFARVTSALPDAVLTLDAIIERERAARALSTMSSGIDLRQLVLARLAAANVPAAPMTPWELAQRDAETAAQRDPLADRLVGIEFVQPPPDDESAKWRRARRLRYKLKEAARRLDSTATGPRWCSRKRRKGMPIELWTKGTGTADAGGVKAFSRGLFRCGQLWGCPVCAATIQAAARRDIRTIVKLHREATATRAHPQGGAYLLTLTMRHSEKMPLGVCREAIQDAWRGMTRGAPWKRLKERMAFIGQVRALEVTHGVNGWHVHIHALLLVAAPWSEARRVQVEDAIFERWAAMLDANGTRAKRYGVIEPDREHGIDLRLANTMTGDYLAKLGIADEVAGGEGKRGRSGSRTPLQILADYDATRSAEDKKLWREYTREMKGARQVTYSRGLRQLYALPEEQTDIEIAQDQSVLVERERVMPRLLATVSPEMFDVIRRATRVPELMLCEAAEFGGLEGVRGEVARLAYYATEKRSAPDRRSETREGASAPWTRLADQVLPEVQAPPTSDERAEDAVVARQPEDQRAILEARAARVEQFERERMRLKYSDLGDVRAAFSDDPEIAARAIVPANPYAAVTQGELWGHGVGQGASRLR